MRAVPKRTHSCGKNDTVLDLRVTCVCNGCYGNKDCKADCFLN